MNAERFLTAAPEAAVAARANSDPLRSHLVEFRDKHAIPAVGVAVMTRDGRLDVDVVGVRVRGGSEPVARDDC
jgi:hypothetical protein